MVFSLKHAGIAVVFLGSFSFYSLVFSSSLGKAKLEFTGELGVNHLQLGNSSYQITETETDNLHQTHNPVVGQFSLGVGYFFLFLALLLQLLSGNGSQACEPL